MTFTIQEISKPNDKKQMFVVVDEKNTLVFSSNDGFIKRSTNLKWLLNRFIKDYVIANKADTIRWAEEAENER